MMYGLIELFWIAIFVSIEPCEALNTHVHPKELHNFMSKRDLSRYFGVETHDEVPEYDVVHPVQVDSQGNYLTHHLKGAFRRSTDAAKEDTSKIHYKLNAFGEDLHLTLTKNHALMAPTFKSNVLGKNGKVLRSRKLKNCHYHGRTKSHDTSKVAISNCKGLTGIIKTPKSSYFIEPIPEHLKGKLKPNGVKQPHLIFKNHGYQKRKHINTQNHTKYLEDARVVHFCGTKDNSSIKLNPLFHDVIGERRVLPSTDGVKTKIIEAHLVVDQKMVNFHGVDNVEQFALSAVNIAAKVLMDNTIGEFPVKYTLVKLSILSAPQEGLTINHHASNTLDSLGNWGKEQNKADDDDPDHFDHVSLFTRYNICADSNQPCDTLGLAPLSGMCRFPISATVNQDNGLLVGMTLAHETGHNIGMNHDYVGGCRDAVNVMATSASGKPSAFEWSTCSRNFYDTFLKLDQASCLNDEPQQEGIKDLDELEKPGVLYDADTQCADSFGEGSKLCSIESTFEKICFQLWCHKPSDPRSCISGHEPAAEGTKCGEEKWCERGVCVEKGDEPPGAVDGSWSSWSAKYSQCSRTCGGGIQERTRSCDSPQPQKGGKDCEGESTEYKLCQPEACPSDADAFLNVQCKKLNDKLFGDRKYNWEFHPSDLENPCELGCFIVNSDEGYAMGPVEDGTDCETTDENGKCINGFCQKIGCDGVIGSSAKPDRCGVCNGDGSSCAGKGKYFKGTVYFDGNSNSNQFKWVIVHEQCSVTCAGGIAVTTSECRRIDDSSLVGESFCDAGTQPPKKELPCNVQPCPPTWQADGWEDCSKTCSTGVRRRNVKCAQVVKENTNEEIEESVCAKTAGQKPVEIEQCNTYACDPEWLAKNFGECTTTCGEGVRERAVVCIRPGDNGQNSEVPEAECKGLVKPFLKEKCNEENPCPGEDACGGTFSDARGKLSSPGFPNDYPDEQECVYSINVQSGSKIKVSFDSFKIDSADEPEGEEQCTGDRLEIYDGNCAAIEVAAVTKYCGNSKPDPYLSTVNVLCLKFISDSSQSASGFNANYVACTGKCDGPDGSPSAPVPAGAAAGQPSGSAIAKSETSLRKSKQTVPTNPYSRDDTILIGNSDYHDDGVSEMDGDIDQDKIMQTDLPKGMRPDMVRVVKKDNPAKISKKL